MMMVSCVLYVAFYCWLRCWLFIIFYWIEIHANELVEWKMLFFNVIASYHKCIYLNYTHTTIFDIINILLNNHVKYSMNGY